MENVKRTEQSIAKREFEKELSEENFADIRMLFWLGQLFQRRQGNVYHETPRQIGRSIINYANLSQAKRRERIQIRSEAVAHHKMISSGAITF